MSASGNGDGRSGLRRLDSDPRGGRAAALNAGIRAANGELVILLADDFVPAPGWLDEHLAVHRRDPRPEAAAVGPAFFPETVRVDPFARWLEDYGLLFGVSFTTCGDELPGTFFWCGNVSLKRAFLLGGPLFDERFPDAAWDDYELGLRLFERGLHVRYAPGAATVHEHPLTLSERRAVMRKAGKAAATFDSIYPRPHRWATGTDPGQPDLPLSLEAAAASMRFRLRGREADCARFFELTLQREFLAAGSTEVD